MLNIKKQYINMKSLRSIYLLTAMLVSGIASAQESDDLYFSVKDREQEMVAKRAANAKLNAMTMRETMQDDAMRSKFSNPDYQSNTNQSVARMPYFKKDYKRDYNFNSIYTNNQAVANNRWGFMNNPFMSPLSMGMMFGNPMMGNMFGNPYGFGMNSMMYDPYMMNTMAFGNPMMGNMFGNPYGFGMNSMMYDPFMMNSWGMGSRFGMGWGNSWGMNSMFGNPWGHGFGMNSMFYGRGMMMSPVVYNNLAYSAGRTMLSGADNNSATRPTNGADYVNYMKSSSDYGNYANSSVGNSSTYSAVEYKGGSANSYFYGTPSTTNGSNWGTRSVDYNNGGSYNRINSNSSFGNGGGFGGNSGGFGSGGGGGSRSSGGRGGRGN
jgi:uncharacterized membrane protein YgcG